MSDTAKQAARFYAIQGDEKGREVVTMADLRQAVWRVTKKHTAELLLFEGGRDRRAVWQNGKHVGYLSGALRDE